MQRDSETPEKVFGSRVAMRLEALGWNQRDFASKLTKNGMPVDASAVSRMLKGKRAMRLSEVYVVSDTIGVNVNALLPNLTTKREELARLRDEQHRLWVDMAKRMVDFVRANDEVVGLLEQDESLIEVINSGSSGDPLRSSEEYLRWTASRAEAGVLELLKTDRLEAFQDFAWVADEAEKAEVLLRIQQFLAPFVLTVETNALDGKVPDVEH